MPRSRPGIRRARRRAAGARLAMAQLQGAPGQAAVSLAAIVASFSLMVAMAIMVASFRISLDAWLDQVLPADSIFAQRPRRYGLPVAQGRSAHRLAQGVRRAEFLRTRCCSPPAGRAWRCSRARSTGGSAGAAAGRRFVHAARGRTAALVGQRGDGRSVRYRRTVGGIADRGQIATLHGRRDLARLRAPAGTVVIERDLRSRTGDRKTTARCNFQPGAATQRSRGGTRRPRRRQSGVRRTRRDPRGSLNIFDRTFAVTYALKPWR